ncbi:hypothetical protein D3C73_528140 [compost metagenome]
MLPSIPRVMLLTKPFTTTLYCSVSGSMATILRDKVVYSMPSGAHSSSYGSHLLELYMLGKMDLLLMIFFVSTFRTKMVPSTTPHRFPSGPKDRDPIMRGFSSISRSSSVNSSIFLPLATSQINILACGSEGSLPNPPHTVVLP